MMKTPDEDAGVFPIEGSRLHGTQSKSIAEFPMCPNPCNGHLLWEDDYWRCETCESRFLLYAEPE